MERNIKVMEDHRRSVLYRRESLREFGRGSFNLKIRICMVSKIINPEFNLQ